MSETFKIFIKRMCEIDECMNDSIDDAIHIFVGKNVITQSSYVL